MDYRYRKYFLVKIPSDSYDMRLRYFRIAAPSLKIHSPYNHFTRNIARYDGDYTRCHGLASNWNMMISFKKEEYESLYYELRKSKRNDKGADFQELHKEFVGQ